MNVWKLIVNNFIRNIFSYFLFFADTYRRMHVPCLVWMITLLHLQNIIEKPFSCQCFSILVDVSISPSYTSKHIHNKWFIYISIHAYILKMIIFAVGECIYIFVLYVYMHKNTDCSTILGTKCYKVIINMCL